MKTVISILTLVFVLGCVARKEADSSTLGTSVQSSDAITSCNSTLQASLKRISPTNNVYVGSTIQWQVTVSGCPLYQISYGKNPVRFSGDSQIFLTYPNIAQKGFVQSVQVQGLSSDGKTLYSRILSSEAFDILEGSNSDYSGFKCEVILDNATAVVSTNSSGGISGSAPSFGLQISSGTVLSRILSIQGFGVTPSNLNSGTIALAHKAEVQISQLGSTPILVTLAAADNASQQRTCQISALVTSSSSTAGTSVSTDYSGFYCNASLNSTSQTIRVDESGNAIEAAPNFLFQVSTGSVLSRIVSVRGVGLQSAALDLYQQSTVHSGSFVLSSVGFVPVTVTVAAIGDSSQIRTCELLPQVIAQVQLPPAPTCELQLSSTVLRVGDTFTAQLVPQGIASSGSIDGTDVSAFGKITLTATSVGNFVVNGSVTGKGGTGLCQKSYTVREKCKADYYVNSTIGARNAPRYDVGGGVAPTGNIASMWQAAGGDAPALLLSGLKGGDKVELTSVSGAVHFCNPAAYGWPWWSCYVSCDSMGPYPESTNYPSLVPVLQFTNDAGIVQSAPVKTMFNTNAIILQTVHGVQMTVPENATRIFGGYPDGYSADNSPTSVEACSVQFHVTPKCD